MDCSSQKPLIGRQAESERLRSALRDRESLLIFGPADVGKTALVQDVISRAALEDRGRCIYWAGAVSVRQLVGELVRLLYIAGDQVVIRKVKGDRARKPINGWLREQTSGRLKLLLYEAAQKTRYSFFFDHLPAASPATAKLFKEIIWRCKTPVYLIARGSSPGEIGSAWSIYFTAQYHIRLGPLSEFCSRELLERCIDRFGLASLDLAGFREEILRMSCGLPGAIIKMCELAAQPRYRYGDQVKFRLIHVDYLMGSNLPDPSHSAPQGIHEN